MDPFTWALIYWLGVAGLLYWGAQKALELWPLDAPANKPSTDSRVRFDDTDAKVT